MKRLLTILLLLTSILSLQAQTETEGRMEGSRVKDFGGFILDMSTMLNAESLTLPPFITPLTPLSPTDGISFTPINFDAFKLNPNLTYLGTMNLPTSYTSPLSVLHTGVGSGMLKWQGASYRLNNGMRINLYGEYNADGHKVYNPSALPWERNQFHGAFEMKSANGSFGIKVEVHGGRNYPY